MNNAQKFSIIESKNIGKNSTIWSFVHILPEAEIGDNVNICDHCFIENNVVIGDNVTIKTGVSIWEGVAIEDKVQIGPNVSFTNDLYPRAKNKDYKMEKTLLKEGCSIGANATILAGNTLGKYSLIGAGSVVTKDVPDFAIVFGNPAIIQGYICVCTNKIVFEDESVFICPDCKRKYEKEKNIIKLIK